MRRIYLKPETEITTYYGDVVMAAASPGRYTDGGPTDTGDGPNLPGTVGETDDDTDPYGGHGQGSGGGGNRAKEWDMWDFDPWG